MQQPDLFSCSDGKPPSAPHNHTSTSIIAAGMARKSIVADWTQVLVLLAVSNGMTTDEIEHVSGLKHQTASARVNGLVLRGFAEYSDERRLTRSGCPAKVVRITDDGRRSIEEI